MPGTTIGLKELREGLGAYKPEEQQIILGEFLRSQYGIDPDAPDEELSERNRGIKNQVLKGVYPTAQPMQPEGNALEQFGQGFASTQAKSDNPYTSGARDFVKGLSGNQFYPDVDTSGSKAAYVGHEVANAADMLADPVFAALTMATGGIGGAAEGVAGKVVGNSLAKMALRTGIRAAGSAAGPALAMGGAEAAKAGLKENANPTGTNDDGEATIDWSKVLKAGKHGAAVGTMFGLAGGALEAAGSKLIPNRLLNPTTKEGIQVGAAASVPMARTGAVSSGVTQQAYQQVLSNPAIISNPKLQQFVTGLGAALKISGEAGAVAGAQPVLLPEEGQKPHIPSLAEFSQGFVSNVAPATMFSMVHAIPTEASKPKTIEERQAATRAAQGRQQENATQQENAANIQDMLGRAQDDHETRQQVLDAIQQIQDNLAALDPASEEYSQAQEIAAPFLAELQGRLQAMGQPGMAPEAAVPQAIPGETPPETRPETPPATSFTTMAQGEGRPGAAAGRGASGGLSIPKGPEEASGNVHKAGDVAEVLSPVDFVMQHGDKFKTPAEALDAYRVYLEMHAAEHPESNVIPGKAVEKGLVEEGEPKTVGGSYTPPEFPSLTELLRRGEEQRQAEAAKKAEEEAKNPNWGKQLMEANPKPLTEQERTEQAIEEALGGKKSEEPAPQSEQPSTQSEPAPQTDNRRMRVSQDLKTGDIKVEFATPANKKAAEAAGIIKTGKKAPPGERYEWDKENGVWRIKHTPEEWQRIKAEAERFNREEEASQEKPTETPETKTDTTEEPSQEKTEEPVPTPEEDKTNDKPIEETNDEPTEVTTQEPPKEPESEKAIEEKATNEEPVDKITGKTKKQLIEEMKARRKQGADTQGEAKSEPEATPEPAADEKAPEYGASNAIVSKDRYKEVQARLKKNLGPGRLHSGVDPQLISDAMEVALFHLEATGRKFAEWTKAMVEDIGEVVRPYLQAIWNATKDWDMDGPPFDPQDAMDAIGLVNLLRDEGKDLKAIVNEAKMIFGPDIEPLIRSSYQAVEAWPTEGAQDDSPPQPENPETAPTGGGGGSGPVAGADGAKQPSGGKGGRGAGGGNNGRPRGPKSTDDADTDKPKGPGPDGNPEVDSDADVQPGRGDNSPEPGGTPEPPRTSSEVRKQREADEDAVASTRDSDYFTPYVARHLREHTAPHPGTVVETRALASVPYPDLTYEPSKVIAEAHDRNAISDVQLDAITAAGQAIEKGHGVLIADDVGVGKSREIMGTALDQIAKGNANRVLVLTTGSNVMEGLRNEAMILTEGKPGAKIHFLTDHNGAKDVKTKVENGQTVPTKKGAIRKGLKVGNKEIWLTDKHNFAEYSEAILNDIAPDLVIFDEAHEYRNLEGNSNLVKFYNKLHEELWDTAQFVYATATPGTDLGSLEYLYGLREWNPGNFSSWMRAKRGLMTKEEAARFEQRITKPLPKVGTVFEVSGVARTGTGHMVMAGEFNDRPILVDYKEPNKFYHWDDLAPEKGNVTVTQTGFNRALLQNETVKQTLRAAMNRLVAMGGRPQGPERGGITSTPALAEQAVRELKMSGKYMSRDLWRGGVTFEVHDATKNESPVSGVAATRKQYDEFIGMVRQIRDAIKEFNLAKLNKSSGQKRAVALSQLQGEAKRRLGYMRTIEAIDMAKKSLAEGKQVVISMELVTGDTEAEEAQKGFLRGAINQINTENVTYEGRKPVYSEPIPEAVAIKENLLESIKGMEKVPSTVELVTKAFGKDNVAVITGSETKSARADAIEKFQKGELKVAIISRAAKTGLSLHDVNGAQRHLIITDFPWEAHMFKQEMGRVDRTGQKSSPIMSAISLGMAAEKKFLATVAKRMKGLGAVSKGAEGSAGADPLADFEIGDGAIERTAIRETWAKMDMEDKHEFTANNKLSDGDNNPVARFPDTVSPAQFMMELQLVDPEVAERTFNTFMGELQHQMANLGEGAATTAKNAGTILRTTPIDKFSNFVEVRAEGAQLHGLLTGMVTPKMPTLKEHLGTGQSRFEQFRDGDDTVSGLRIGNTFVRQVKRALGVETTSSPETIWNDLTVIGDHVKLATRKNWSIYARQDGRIKIENTSLKQREELEAAGAKYNEDQRYFYLEGEDAVKKFIEKYPVKQPPPKFESASVRVHEPGWGDTTWNVLHHPDMPGLGITNRNGGYGPSERGLLVLHEASGDTFNSGATSNVDALEVAREVAKQIDTTKEKLTPEDKGLIATIVEKFKQLWKEEEGSSTVEHSLGLGILEWVMRRFRPDAFQSVDETTRNAFTKTMIEDHFPEAGTALNPKAKASGEKFAINLNLDKLNTDDVVKAFMEATAEAIAPAIQERRRNTIAQRETEQVARLMGVDIKEMLKWPIGKAANAEELTAARMMLVTSGTKVQELAKKIAPDVPHTQEDLANFASAIALHRAIQAHVAGLTAEAGRALNAMKIKVKSEALKQQAIEQAIDGLGGTDTIEALAGRLRELGDHPEQVSRLLRQSKWAKTVDQLTFVFINSVLSGVPTHAGNFLSNGLAVGTKLATHWTAAQLGKIKGHEGRVTEGEIAAEIHAAHMALGEAWEAAKEAAKTNTSRFDMDPNGAYPEPKLLGSRKLSAFIGAPGRAMKAGDEYFKVIHNRMELHRLAYREAMQELRDGDITQNQFDDRVRHHLNNPTDSMLKAAWNDANYYTFTTPLKGKGRLVSLARAAMGLKREVPEANFFLPFVKTPVNIIKFAGEHSILGRLSEDMQKELAKGGVDQDIANAKMVVGQAALTMAMAAAFAGLVTGAGPADKEQLKALRLTGWKPYSIHVPGVGYFDYRRLAPVGLWIGAGADLVESFKYERSHEGVGGFAGAAGHFGAALVGSTLKQSFLKGMADFADAVTNPQEGIGESLANIGSALVPYSSLRRNITQTIDPTMRSFKGVGQKIVSETPFLSQTLPKRINFFGEDLQAEGGPLMRGVSPANAMPFTKQRDSKAASEMSRLGIEVTEPKHTFNGERIPADVYEKWAKTMGTEMKRRLEGIVAQAGYDRLTDEQKADQLRDAIKDIHRTHNQRLRGQLLFRPQK